MTEIIDRFYTAFSKLDFESMASCYHDDIIFEDPAFGILQGNRARAMWEMLCTSQKGKDFKIEYSNITAHNATGTAQWEAYYKFSKTGRKIHNKIDATFKFKDDLIIEHTDHFSLSNWARQAFGFKGLILGKTGFFKLKLQSQTNNALDKFIKLKN